MTTSQVGTKRVQSAPFLHVTLRHVHAPFGREMSDGDNRTYWPTIFDVMPKEVPAALLAGPFLAWIFIRNQWFGAVRWD